MFMLSDTLEQFRFAAAADLNCSSVLIGGGRMVPCTRILWKKILRKHVYGNVSSHEWHHRKCAKKSTRYFRVEYSELTHGDTDDKKFDIFALCAKCAAEAVAKGDRFWFPKEKRTTIYGTTHYMSDRPVYGLRGNIGSVTEIQGAESTFRNDLKDRHRSRIKAAFFSTMKRSCYKTITPDEWKQIFTDLYEEFVVESVLHS